MPFPRFVVPGVVISATLKGGGSIESATVIDTYSGGRMLSVAGGDGPVVIREEDVETFVVDASSLASVIDAAEKMPVRPAIPRLYPRPKGGRLVDVTPKKAFGRNDDCPCGSGKKFKKCCIRASVG